jgi:hypothetical protein
MSFNHESTYESHRLREVLTLAQLMALKRDARRMALNHR